MKSALGDHKQKWLADRLGTTETAVSRWLSGRTRPHASQVPKIAQLLEAPDLVEVFEATKPANELYVAAPISGLDPVGIGSHRDDVARIVEAASDVANGVYWPGQDIYALGDLAAPDLVTRDNLQVLSHCHALLYVQFAPVMHPTGALIELGFALGRKIKTTIMIQKHLPIPFMLKNFEGVAARSSIMPDARVYLMDDVEHAVQTIANNGREIFGLS